MEHHDLGILIDEICARLTEAVKMTGRTDIRWGDVAYLLAESEELSSRAGICAVDAITKGVLFSLSSHLSNLHRKVMEVGGETEQRHGIIRAHEFAEAVRRGCHG